MIKSLSVIFPLYNEANRLFYTFNDIKKFYKVKKIKNIEYIFVDDGSTDQSVEIIKNFFKKNKKINYKIIRIKKNKGKGNAIKCGVIHSKNDWILTIDTDISVSLIQLNEWIKKEFIKKNVSIYFGSRNLKNSKVEFKIYRNIIGKIFTYILKILFEIEINDTQCGFKLYKKKVAKSIFAKIKDNGFIHDVEVFLLSKKYNYPVKELPVKWIHKKESKLNLLFDIFKMFFALIKIKKNI